jgi:hypothetical protein
MEAEQDVHWKINTGATEAGLDGGLVNGVRVSDGDGTVRPSCIPSWTYAFKLSASPHSWAPSSQMVVELGLEEASPRRTSFKCCIKRYLLDAHLAEVWRV